MKSLGLCLLNVALLAMLVACGKDNESGKSSQWNYNNPYSSGYNGYPSTITSGNAPAVAVSIINNYPCSNSQYGTAQRIPIQVPLTNTPFVVSPGDVHIGVTSFGDVAVIYGTAIGQPPVFVGYMCPRSFTQSGSGQLYDVAIGAASQRCSVKQITRATIAFPGGATAAFRALDYGKYFSYAQGAYQPFTPYCQ